MILLQDSNLEPISPLMDAFNINYQLNNKALDFLQFSLPIYDPLLLEIRHGSIVTLTEDEPAGGLIAPTIGVFKIRQIITQRAANDERVDFHCESMLTTLTEDIITKLFNDTWATNYAIMNVLKKQTKKYWELGLYKLEEEEQRTFDWEKVTLLEAIFSIEEGWQGDYYFRPDYSSFPWDLDFLKVKKEGETEPLLEIIEGHNLISYQKTRDTQDMATKLYVFGKDGIGIESANPTKLPYITNNTGEYGVISKIYEDRDTKNAQTLLWKAKKILRGLSQPIEYYDINFVDKAERGSKVIGIMRPGDLVRLVTKHENVALPVETIQRNMDTGETQIRIGKSASEMVKIDLSIIGGSVS